LAEIRSGWLVLRKEQLEQLERNHREDQATKRKARLVTDVTSTALKIEEIALRL
jgi:hypothetical protein